jgi:carbonic anhydrase
MLAHYFQIPEKEVAAKSVPDPRKAVAVDVAVHRRPSTDDSRLASGRTDQSCPLKRF